MILTRFIRLLCLLIFGFQTYVCQAQLLGMEFLVENNQRVTIPFTNVDNFIVLSVRLNGILPVKFILDTGAKNSILIHKELSNILNLQYERELFVYGADMSSSVRAYLVRNVNIELQGIIAQRQSMLVLDEDIFSFEKHLGVPIAGILGVDFFRRFIIKINYRTNELIFYEREAFNEPLQKYDKLPVNIVNGRMFIETPIQFSPEQTHTTRLLLDTGASTALIINTNRKDSLLLPKQLTRGHIGRGLGGYLKGFSGRIDYFKFGDYAFENIAAHFQQLDDSTALHVFGNGANLREGLLGSDILSRFHIIFDYNREAIYVKPNARFKQKVRYDKSGLYLIASGIDLRTFSVDYVLPNSPADRAGIQVGDELVSYNGLGTNFHSLAGITRKLQGKVGKTVKMTLRRKKVLVRVHFKLENLF